MHFPSGMAGISIVLFALMGTIGVGYLLNGNTTYEPVDTYDYVTDVTGLYNYTPVTAYAPYSPAANNYQYSTSIEDLGTYTSGINYTEAGAANLNPIITPSSGYVTTTETIAYADLSEYEVAGSMETLINWLLADAGSGYRAEAAAPAKIISVKDLIADIGSFSSVEISLPNMAASANITSVSQNLTVQPAGVLVMGIYDNTYLAPLTFAVNNSATGATSINSTTRYIVNSSVTNEFTVTGSDNRTYTSWPMGVVSNLTVYPNGTTTYTYSYNGSVSTTTVSTEYLKIYVAGEIPANAGANFTIPDYTPGITYTKTVFNNVDYLDPNYGVSTSANTVYWNNGNDLGSVAILLKKPTNTTSQTFTMYHADNTTALAYTISYNGMTWTLSSSGSPINMGKGWEGILVTAYYTGELQWTPVKQFTNFTDYRLGNTNTIAPTTAGNEPISYCKITSSGQSFNFAVVGTSVASGSVPGAMYNATFTVTDYFPQYDDVRVSFDSAAYVGTSVKVGTWTMDVDSASFIGTFTGADGAERSADLTKPWAIIWTTADTVAVSYTPYNKMGTQTVTVLSADAAKVVTLNGQWVIDTDLYSISTHEEPVYNWNFGHWGLDKIPFIVCVMGLTAVLAIIYRITGVPFSGFDFAIIALANLVLWVIM